MSRIARIVLENIPYHVTQRGNGRQQVFFDAQDYHLYLDLLRVYAEEAGPRLWAYCLMANHVHMIAVPLRADAMASALWVALTPTLRGISTCGQGPAAMSGKRGSSPAL